MTSKWIDELKEECEFTTDNQWNRIFSVLERINKLLRRAMYSTDDEQLSNDIEKEMWDIKDGK
jgi:hypothetical protein